MKRIPLVIYGAGGFAREVAWLAEACRNGELRFEPVCLVDDDPRRHGRDINGIPVVSLDEAAQRYPSAAVIGAIGSPAAREMAMSRADEAGLVPATLIHGGVEMSRFVEVGLGTVICAGNILTANIRLDRHVQVNLDCTIGHDVMLGDFATLAPGVHVSGWVHMGRRVYVGTGAVIVNGTESAPITIGDDAVIGAGAVVTKSVDPGVTVVGVPARPR